MVRDRSRRAQEYTYAAVVDDTDVLDLNDTIFGFLTITTGHLCFSLG